MEFLSTQTNPSDIIVFNPSIEQGTATTIQCALGTAQEVAAGTLGTVQPKNRATNQALQSTFTVTSGAIHQGTLLLNSTHVSRAWAGRPLTDDGGAGSNWLVTQPLQAIATPVDYPFIASLTEVDTWVPGDAFVAYRLIHLYLSSIMPGIGVWDANLSTGVYVQDCATSLIGSADAGDYSAPVVLGNGTVFVESQTTAGPSAAAIQFKSDETSWNASLNSYVSSYEASTVVPTGGAIFAGILFDINGGLGYSFDYDTILSSNEFDISSGIDPNVGTVYLDVGSFLVGIPPGGVWVSGISSGQVAVYGPGGLATHQRGFLQYDPGPGMAEAELLNSGGIYINNVQFACSHTGAGPDAADTFHCNIPLTAAHLDGDAGPNGFGGNAFVPGCGSVSNFPQ